MKSFCCMSLQTGCTILAWLNLVSSILVTGYFSYVWVLIKLGISWFAYGKPVEVTVELIIIACIVGYFVLSYIASVCMLLGIRKQNHLMLLPCLVNFSLDYIISFVYMILTLFRSNPKMIYIYEVANILVYALMFYILLGIYSLYEQFKRGRDEKQKNKLYGFVKV